jgi:hypothetical protein
MDNSVIANIIIGIFLLSVGVSNVGTKVTFPWTRSDITHPSFTWALQKEDLITLFLAVMGVLIVFSGDGGVAAGSFFIAGAVFSHIMFHLRASGGLVHTATPYSGAGKDTGSLREIYLSIVKRWHPDQATSTEDFMRRNHITALANKAWDAKDATSLEALNALKKGD